MFSRSGKTGKLGVGFASLQSDVVELPKYPKPRILLIDIKDDSEALLRKGGFNVSSGSFGTPYRVPKSDQYLPVIPNDKLRDVEEQEIVIIDLVPNDPLGETSGEKVTSDGESDWWAKCNIGVIDPRPRIMDRYQRAFDRILAHGGVFIVFADSRDSQQFVLGYTRPHYGLTIESRISSDNWSFLSILGWAEVQDDRGSEIEPDFSLGELGIQLSRHFKGTRFHCTLRFTEWKVREKWISVANNKFGGSVGGILLPDNDRKGLVILFPQVKDKSGLINELLTTVLPNLSPHLFPHVEGARWVERLEYEIPSILRLREEKERAQIEAQKRIQNLELQIQKERSNFGYLYDLIRATDKELVAAVRRTLSLLGFKKIKDVDQEKLKSGDSERDEDLQIDDYSPLLLVEIKGIGGLPTDEDALQVAKHIAPRMKQLKRDDIQGLTIINHQRHLPALERENRSVFREKVEASAKKKHDVGLFTSWDLYRLARSYLLNDWTHDEVKDIFYQKGRISIAPKHYQFIGTVDEFWEKAGALSVKVEEGTLARGDRIAYELPVEFLEEKIESLQIESEPVDKASKGVIVGIKTGLQKDQAKKGIRLYRVTDITGSETISDEEK